METREYVSMTWSIGQQRSFPPARWLHYLRIWLHFLQKLEVSDYDVPHECDRNVWCATLVLDRLDLVVDCAV